MQNYEAIKAEIMTALAKVVTAEEIKTKNNLVIFVDIQGEDTELQFKVTASGIGFVVDALRGGVLVFCCHFTFSELELERKQLINKPRNFMKSFDDVCIEKNIKHSSMLSMLIIAGVIDHFDDCIVNQKWIDDGLIIPIPIRDSLAAGLLHEYSPTDLGLLEIKNIVKLKVSNF